MTWQRTTRLIRMHRPERVGEGLPTRFETLRDPPALNKLPADKLGKSAKTPPIKIWPDCVVGTAKSLPDAGFLARRALAFAQVCRIMAEECEEFESLPPAPTDGIDRLKVTPCLIGPSGLQIHEQMPDNPVGTLRNYELLGLAQPFCAFKRDRPLPVGWHERLRKKHWKEGMDALPPAFFDEMDAERARATDYPLSETELDFTDLVPASNATWCLPGDPLAIPRSNNALAGAPTSVGRVAQWLALTSNLSECLRTWRSPSYPIADECALRGVDRNSNLVIGTQGEHRIVALNTRGVLPTSAPFTLTTAGAIVLLWACAHVRLRAMLDDVRDLAHKASLVNCAAFLADPKPVLTWSDADFKRLDDARSELVSWDRLWLALSDEWVSAKDAVKRSNLNADTIRKRAEREHWPLRKVRRINWYRLADLERAWPKKNFRTDK